MVSPVVFPIRVKLLSLMAALVATLTGAYLAIAIGLFREDKTQVVYELNASNVKTLAAQLDAALRKIADKVVLLTQGYKDEVWARAIFTAEPELVSFTLYSPSSDGTRWNASGSVRNSDYLKLYGLGPGEVDKLREKFPIPFGAVLSKRTYALNSTLPDGAPLLTLALAVTVVDRGLSREQVAVVDLRMDRLLKLVAREGAATVFVVDAQGRAVAHPDSKVVYNQLSFEKLPIVEEALSSPIHFQLKRFVFEGRSWLGAYSSVGMGGLFVISQVEEGAAFLAARRLIEKSIWIALLFMTLALLAALWLAGSFTQPLESLMEATEKLAQGEYGHSIHVNTRDEIGRLARSFNAMAGDLQNKRLQLENNARELEIKVRERTAELEAQQKQLSDAQESLLRTTRLASLGELAGAAAHEVLNPLNNISIRIERMKSQLKDADENDTTILSDISTGWSKAWNAGGWDSLKTELEKPADGGKKLIDEDLENLTAIARKGVKRTSEREQDFDFVNREAARITRIVNGMRSLSRVGGERRPVDIHVPIEDTLITVTEALDRNQITLVKEFSADPRERLSILGDRDELVQVFSNLLRNSVQAVSSANRRAGEIQLSTRRQGDRVEVRIQDNGGGISKANLPKMFEPNFTTKSLDEGTGLGLSISRRIVRAFGGDIEIERTAEGEGTTFLVWFPALS